MTYEDCLSYLFSRLPMYQRVGQAAYKADLDTTIELLKRIGNPEKEFRSVHIAGTNGKGSVSHMLASVLQESGYTTGLYTSPHLKDFRERIKINGELISEQKVIDFVERNMSLVSDISPSFFEWTVALAFKYFAEEKVDIAVVETGMGGRLDSTNVLLPELSIITNISHDHTRFLGDFLSQIAGEKAGIIKEEVPVIIGKYADETRYVFEDRANLLNAPIIFSADNKMKEIESDLKGPYQKENLQTALNSLLVLKDKGYQISEDSISRGMKNVISNTGLHGRWEVIGNDPKVLIDMAHNKEGIELVMKEIAQISCDKLHMVWGMVDDKDLNSILKLLPKKAVYYFCRPEIPRGLGVEILYQHAMSNGLTGRKYNSVKEALSAAKKEADKNDLIFVGGSTFVVAEVLP